METSATRELWINDEAERQTDPNCFLFRLNIHRFCPQTSFPLSAIFFLEVVSSSPDFKYILKCLSLKFIFLPVSLLVPFLSCRRMIPQVDIRSHHLLHKGLNKILYYLKNPGLLTHRAYWSLCVPIPSYLPHVISLTVCLVYETFVSNHPPDKPFSIFSKDAYHPMTYLKFLV